jgi:benzoyl-CoA reductase/2-hydroxyglutaryl-CoA dehydratase subunit BcrC/BadD/HgdB
MGLVPVVLWGLSPFASRTTEADQHVQGFVCSVGRHLTEFVLSEEGASLDGLFMYNACDTLRNLPEILRYGLEKKGRHLPLLNIHIPMVPLRQTNGRAYLRNEINALVHKVEDTFGCGFSMDRFQESVDQYREARELARQAERAVAEGRLGLKRYVQLMQGNYFRPVEAQMEALASALSDAAGRVQGALEPHASGRIILSGILPPHGEVCSLIEEAGLRVVGNDIASLARTYSHTPDASASPADYYGEFYFQHHPCPTLLGSGDDRLGVLESLVSERDAKGILFLGEKYCEYEYFEFPYLQRYFKEKGVHTLLLEFAVDDDQNLGAVKTRIEAFSEMIGWRTADASNA